MRETLDQAKVADVEVFPMALL
ncbi:hypothetical protein WG66_011140, partial [Moniliophthora roreri]